MLISKVIYMFILALFMISNQVVAGNNSFNRIDSIDSVFKDLGYQSNYYDRNIAIHYVKHNNAINDFKNMSIYINNISNSLLERKNIQNYMSYNFDYKSLINRYHKHGGIETFNGNAIYASIYYHDISNRLVSTCTINGPDINLELEDIMSKLIDIDNLAHEIGHCVFLKSYSNYDELNKKYPGLNLNTISKRNKLKEDSYEKWLWHNRYFIHVNEVFADIHSLFYILSFNDLEQKYKVNFINYLINKRSYDIESNEDHITHYTVHYLNHLRDNLHIFDDFDMDMFLRNPVHMILDYMYDIGKDYSITEDSFYKTFNKNYLEG